MNKQNRNLYATHDEMEIKVYKKGRRNSNKKKCANKHLNRRTRSGEG